MKLDDDPHINAILEACGHYGWYTGSSPPFGFDEGLKRRKLLLEAAEELRKLRAFKQRVESAVTVAE